MTAQGLLDHGPFSRAASGTILGVLLVCLPGLAACGSLEEPHVQRVAYCQGPSSDDPEDGLLDVEFRQGSTVVAQDSVSAGTPFIAEVPVGAVQIFVDGKERGAFSEGVPTDGPHHSPAPDEVTYVAAGEGCPDIADL